MHHCIDYRGGDIYWQWSSNAKWDIGTEPKRHLYTSYPEWGHYVKMCQAGLMGDRVSLEDPSSLTEAVSTLEVSSTNLNLQNIMSLEVKLCCFFYHSETAWELFSSVPTALQKTKQTYA